LAGDDADEEEFVVAAVLLLGGEHERSDKTPGPRIFVFWCSTPGIQRSTTTSAPALRTSTSQDKPDELLDRLIAVAETSSVVTCQGASPVVLHTHTSPRRRVVQPVRHYSLLLRSVCAFQKNTGARMCSHSPQKRERPHSSCLAAVVVAVAPVAATRARCQIWSSFCGACRFLLLAGYENLGLS
jgi:hypothetical protein